MLRSVIRFTAQAALVCLAAAAVVTAAPTPRQTPAPHPARVRPAHPVRKPEPRAPKTAQELTQDLSAALHTGYFTRDSIQVEVRGQDILLSGVIHSAEDKGVATRDARQIAEKDGWTNYHVLNTMTVNLPPQN